MVGNIHELFQFVNRWFAPWKRRIQSMIGKCLISTINDSTSIQLSKIQFLSDELIDKVERMQQFGFTSVPPSGSEAIVISLGGNQQHPVVISTDSSTYRLKNLPDGSVALYNMQGDYIKLTNDTIEISAGTINIGDGSSFKKLINEEFQSLFNNHGHDYIPSGTGTPSITGRPVNGIIATTTPTPITNNEMTSKTTAE